MCFFPSTLIVKVEGGENRMKVKVESVMVTELRRLGGAGGGLRRRGRAWRDGGMLGELIVLKEGLLI